MDLYKQLKIKLYILYNYFKIIKVYLKIYKILLIIIVYINPNVFPSLIAKVSLSYNISLLGYSGKSN